MPASFFVLRHSIQKAEISVIFFNSIIINIKSHYSLTYEGTENKYIFPVWVQKFYVYDSINCVNWQTDRRNAMQNGKNAEKSEKILQILLTNAVGGDIL